MRGKGKDRRATVLGVVLPVVLCLAGGRQPGYEETAGCGVYRGGRAGYFPGASGGHRRAQGRGEFQFIYQSGEDLYIAKGYGRQETSGYSIQAKELYLTKDCLVFDTELTGPGEGRRCRRPPHTRM